MIKKIVFQVASFVEDAKSQGATVVRGGKKSDFGESYYEPTLLSNVTSGMLVSKEEIFGPVAGISK